MALTSRRASLSPATDQSPLPTAPSRSSHILACIIQTLSHHHTQRARRTHPSRSSPYSALSPCASLCVLGSSLACYQSKHFRLSITGSPRSQPPVAYIRVLKSTRPSRNGSSRWSCDLARAASSRSSPSHPLSFRRLQCPASAPRAATAHASTTSYQSTKAAITPDLTNSNYLQSAPYRRLAARLAH